MKNKKSKKNLKVKQQRVKYTAESKAKALKYYMIGLSLSEISILLNNCPVRTLEKWQQVGKWAKLKQPENIKIRALELYEAGKSYEYIAKILQISRVTIWRYIKAVKESQKE